MKTYIILAHHDYNVNFPKNQSFFKKTIDIFSNLFYPKGVKSAASKNVIVYHIDCSYITNGFSGQNAESLRVQQIYVNPSR